MIAALAALVAAGSDHCPAMKGIETSAIGLITAISPVRSDHCPAMKGIETIDARPSPARVPAKRPLPRNEGD